MIKWKGACVCGGEGGMGGGGEEGRGGMGALICNLKVSMF